LCQADYHVGDPIPLVKRIDYLHKRSDWTDVPHSIKPLFGINTKTTLDQLSESMQFNPMKTLKIQFGFDDMRHLTEWIKVTDGKQHYLTHLKFTIEHTADYITKVQHRTIYDTLQTSRSQKILQHLTIEFEWQELPQQQPVSALTTLMTIVTVVFWMSVVLMFVDKYEPEKKNVT